MSERQIIRKGDVGQMPEEITKNLLAVADISKYAIMELDPAELRDVLAVNLGDGGIGLGDLEVIKVGRGGSVKWDIPDVDEDARPKELTGVIVYFRDTRAWWQAGLEESGGGQPPDCSSQDSVHGDGAFGTGSQGNPSGLCARCPQAGWGTARKGTGRGQACRIARNLFMVPEDSLIPKVVRLPPTSYKKGRGYFVALIGAKPPLKYFAAVSSISLEKVSKGGFDYAVTRFGKPQPLSPDAAARLEAYRNGMMPMFQQTVIKADRDEGTEE